MTKRELIKRLEPFDNDAIVEVSISPEMIDEAANGTEHSWEYYKEHDKAKRRQEKEEKRAKKQQEREQQQLEREQGSGEDINENKEETGLEKL